jgi:hypothetical protein
MHDIENDNVPRPCTSQPAHGSMHVTVRSNLTTKAPEDATERISTGQRPKIQGVT